MNVKKVVIPAAGLGTRFLPATKSQPKEMLPIVDKPAIQYIVEEAIQSGIEDIIIITGRNKRAIEDHFDRSIELELELEQKHKKELLQLVNDVSNLVDIHYIRQKTPLGLGDAIRCARSFIHNEPFAVMLGDDIVDNDVPCLKQLIDFYDEVHSSVVGVQEVPFNELHKYGVVFPTNDAVGRALKISDLVEKPKTNPPSNLAIMGRYVFTPEIFNCLDSIEKGHGGEFQLTDAIQLLLKDNDVYAYNFLGKRFDVGDKLGFLKATVEFALKRDDLGSEFKTYLKKLDLK
jgi:UTP--glucose-1-phosphate uridylyltransferase